MRNFFHLFTRSIANDKPIALLVESLTLNLQIQISSLTLDANFFALGLFNEITKIFA
ncbi:hypothetical protein ALT1644_220036 [Alteromonas macleodii]